MVALIIKSSSIFIAKFDRNQRPRPREFLFENVATCWLPVVALDSRKNHKTRRNEAKRRNLSPSPIQETRKAKASPAKENEIKNQYNVLLAHAIKAEALALMTSKKICHVLLNRNKAVFAHFA